METNKILFEAIRAHDDVWVARCRDVAQWWLDLHGFSDEVIA